MDWPPNLNEIYSHVIDVDYLQNENNKKLTFKKAVKIISKYATRDTKILEIGSYAGFFLDVGKDFGYNIVGIEPSAWGSELSKLKGHIVHNIPAESILDVFLENSFDLVVSWDVLEHIPDPVKLFKDLNHIVQKNGHFICATLDRNSILPLLLRGKWPWVIDMHLHYFSKKQMSYIAEKSGFQLIKTQRYSHNVNLKYALQKLAPNSVLLRTLLQSSALNFITKINLPINLGDMRVYIFSVKSKLGK